MRKEIELSGNEQDSLAANCGLCWTCVDLILGRAVRKWS